MKLILKGSISLVFSSNRDQPRGRRPSGSSSHAAEVPPLAPLFTPQSNSTVILSFPCVAIHVGADRLEVRYTTLIKVTYLPPI